MNPPNSMNVQHTAEQKFSKVANLLIFKIFVFIPLYFPDMFGALSYDCDLQLDMSKMRDESKKLIL